MKLPVTLRIPALGGLEVFGELELPDDLVGGRQPDRLRHVVA